MAFKDNTFDGRFLGPPTLAGAKAERKQDVKVLLERKFAAGRAHGGKTYQLRDQDRTNLIAIKAMLTAGAVDPHDGTYRDIRNVEVELDDTEMEALCDDVFAYCRGLIKAAAAHKDAIDVLETRGSVLAYDITTGWPI